MSMWNTANPARTRRACLATLAGFALIILSPSLAKAQYGPRITLGKNYQQWSGTESANGIDQGQCNGTGCYVLFQAIPQQRPLIVQHVACIVGTDPGDIVSGRIRTRKGQTVRATSTPLVPVPTSSGNYAVSHPVMHLLKSGERPVIFFASNAAGPWGAECSISGRLLQP